MFATGNNHTLVDFVITNAHTPGTAGFYTGYTSDVVLRNITMKNSTA